MAFPNLFAKSNSEDLIKRIDALEEHSSPIWGKMNAAQMLAHCNVTYEMIYTDKHPKPNFLMSLMIKLFVKSKIIGEMPYTKNGPTAPAFKILEEKNFNEEKFRLIEHIRLTQEHGEVF